MLVDTHCHLDLPAGPLRREASKAGMIRDIKVVLLRAKEVGVTTIINVGTSIDASRKSIEIAESTDLVDVYATCGIHAQEGPEDIGKYGKYSSSESKTSREVSAKNINSSKGKFSTSSNNMSLETTIGELKKIAQSSNKVIAIGECGMDYFLETTDKGPATSDEEKKDQRDLFEAQVKLSVDLNLPLIIHCRNAWEETFEIIEKYSSNEMRSFPKNTDNSSSGKFSLRSNNMSACSSRLGSNNKRAYFSYYRSNNNRPDSGVAPLPRKRELIAHKLAMTGGVRGLFHSWTGTVEQAKKALDLGFYISFSGIVTFKNAGEIPEVAKMVPEDRILVETDAPFLTPRRSSPTLKFQGASKTNEPKNVRITAQFLANLRGISLDKISGITTDNAKKLFGLT